MLFAQPLWLLLLLPGLGWLWHCQRKGPRRTHRMALLLGLRTLNCMVLTLALAGLSWRRPGEDWTVTFLLDQSLSTRRQQDFVRDWMQRSLAARPKNLEVGLLLFAGQANLEVPPSLRPYLPKSSLPLESDQSDLAAAVQLGAAAQRSGAGGRLVLLSDGRQTRGDLEQAARTLAWMGLELDTVCLPAPSGPEALIEELRAPTQVAARSPFDLLVKIYSSQATRGDLLLTRQGQPQGRYRLELSAGHNVFLLPQELNQSGVVRHQVQLSLEQDGEPANNRAAALTVVEGPPKVALLRGFGQPDLLGPVLRERGMLVDSLRPDTMPSEVGEWLAFQAIVLDNIAATEFAPEQLDTLQALVSEVGTGLVMLGGADSFGAGGYTHTPLANLLPVDLRVKRNLLTPPTAQIHVIDKSGSMAETTSGVEHMALAREASMAAIELLTPEDQIGVIGFDDAAKWVIPLQAVVKPAALTGRLARLRAGGGTDMFPALEMAIQTLSGGSLSSRHILVLSDGATAPADFARLLSQAKRARIQLSTVAVGQGADLPFLEGLARQGGGRSYRADNARTLPRIFARETMLNSRSAVDDKASLVELLLPHPVVAGVTAAQVRAHNRSAARGAPHRVLLGTAKDPLLAVGRFGLGKTVAFTGDSGRLWCRDWAARGNLAQLLTQAVRWSLPTRPAGGLQVDVTQSQGRLRVRAQAPLEVARLGLQGKWLGPDGSSTELDLMQTRADLFESESPLPKAGNHVLSLSNGQVSWAQPVAVQSSAELSGIEPDRALLQRAAQAGGGRSQPSPEEVFRRPKQANRSYQNAFDSLLALSLLLLLLEVAVRRWPGAGGQRRAPEAAPIEPDLGRLRSKIQSRRRPKSTPREIPVLDASAPDSQVASVSSSNAREELRKIRARRRPPL
jgi:Ca-activated chloride channel family protein